MWHLYLCVIIAVATSHPLQEAPENTEHATTGHNAEKLIRDLQIVSYVQHFKQTIADYVTSEYKTLTYKETEDIMEVLEAFLGKFAKDLRDTVQKEESLIIEDENPTTTEPTTIFPEVSDIQDGLPNETFYEIEQRIKIEFPELKRETVKEIVYKLRKNLYETREKIDRIILGSQRSQLNIENSDNN